MRILGLDYGTKTVGVAMSDPLLLTAQGIEIIRRDHENKLRKTYARIEELVRETVSQCFSLRSFYFVQAQTFIICIIFTNISGPSQYDI